MVHELNQLLKIVEARKKFDEIEAESISMLMGKEIDKKYITPELRIKRSYKVKSAHIMTISPEENELLIEVTSRKKNQEDGIIRMEIQTLVDRMMADGAKTD